MKAVILTQPGGTENLTMQEIPVPQPKPAEVLVQVRAISINPVDIKTRKGESLYAILKQDQPMILGWDITGVIKSVGSDVKEFKEGDAVFGMINFLGHGKAYAEYVVAPAEHLALKPENCTHAEAVAATLAALTAWQILVHEAGIQKGQHVLIHAAAGGVGHYAVQIAKYFGANVSGTASASNIDFLKELGVDQVIDYTTGNFEEQLKDVDIVVDPIGGETTRRSVNVLKQGGTLISMVGGVKEDFSSLIREKNIKAKNYVVHSSGADMKQLAGLIQQGKLKSTVSHQFSFDEIAKAHQQIETGKTRGKIVVNIKAD